MKKLVSAIVVILLIPIISWAVLYREKHISGREFKVFFMSHVEQTYSTWRLYKISQDEFCFEYSRPIVPERYCVDRSEIQVKSRESGDPKIGFVYAEQLSAKEGGPNSKPEPFTKR